MANTYSILTVVLDVVASVGHRDTKCRQKWTGTGGVNFRQFHGMPTSFMDELYGNENSMMLMLPVDHFTKLKIPYL